LKLNLWQKIQLKIQGYVFLRWEKRKGWTDYLPIYLVKCKRHGFFEDYPHGYSKYFICPKCEKEIEKAFDLTKLRPLS
jgi:hypothetical protein